MTASMAEELSNTATAREILSRLERNHFFTQRDSQRDAVYQYHPLFREFLLARAASHLTDEEIRDLQRAAARVLEKSGRIYDAADLFREANDLTNLERFILTQAPNLLSQGRGQTVEALIDSLSSDLLEGSPWLLFWLGVSKMSHSPLDARLDLTRAFHLFETGKDIVGTLLTWSAVVDSMLSVWEFFRPLDPWIEWLDEWVRRDGSFPSPVVEARVASSMAGAIIWRQPYRSDTETWLNRALALSLEIKDDSLCLQSRIWAAINYAWRADLGRLSTIVADVERMALAPTASPLVALLWKTIEAMYYQVTIVSDPLQPVLEGTELARTTGIHVLDYALLVQSVISSFCLGNMERAEEFLQRMGAMVQSSKGTTLVQYHTMLGWFHFIREEITLAGFHVTQAWEFIEEIRGTPDPEIHVRHLGAHVLHQKGEHERALAEIAGIYELVRSSGFTVEDYILFLTEAEFALDRGNEKDALESLRKAMALGKTRGIKTMLFIWRPAVMTRLCAKALEYGIEVSY